MTETSHVTCCPYCDTAFRVNDTQLAAAGGAVRCGACLQVFNAADYLEDENDPPSMSEPFVDSSGTTEWQIDAEITEKPSPILNFGSLATFSDVPERESDDQPDTETDEAGVPDPSFSDRDVSGVDSGEAPDEGDDADRADESGREAEFEAGQDEGIDEVRQATRDIEDEPIDEFEPPGDIPLEEVLAVRDVDAHEEHVEGDDRDMAPDEPPHEPFLIESDLDAVELDDQRSSGSAALKWSAVSVALIIVAAFQYVWFERGRLAQDPQLREYYLQVCSVIGCGLPAFSDPGSLGIAELVIRSHEGRDNALRVDALLTNDASFRQPFPDLALKFSDLRGNPVAQRIFDPGVYLSGEMAGLRNIPARTEVRVSIEIVDPGPDAVNYSLEIL